MGAISGANNAIAKAMRIDIRPGAPQIKLVGMYDLKKAAEATAAPRKRTTATTTPAEIRTRNLRIRNPLLYPVELRALAFFEFIGAEAAWGVKAEDKQEWMGNSHY